MSLTFESEKRTHKTQFARACRSVGTKKRERDRESLVVVLFSFGGKEYSLIIFFDGKKKKTKQICVF